MLNYEMKKRGIRGSNYVNQVVVTMCADTFNRSDRRYNETLVYSKEAFDGSGVLEIQHLISNNVLGASYDNKYGLRFPEVCDRGNDLTLEEIEVVYYDSEGVAWEVKVPYGQFDDMFTAMDNEMVTVEEAAEWFKTNDTQEDHDIFWEQWVPGLYGVVGEEADELFKKYGRNGV